MIVSTTSRLEGKPAKEYLGVVTGEAIIGANLFKDMFAAVRDVVGVDIDYEVLGKTRGMLMVTAAGTAVKVG